ncbi:hypothetical protein MAR_009220 [Mya arenaria]|uniref:Reverse transcriptase n=1 Tax=Mya arenaria TaxID=6604 RepID=A0ABY7DY47_MYAAR|nr:hypothetical protein MAR_009220 [Mya arenaria]
MLKPDKHNPKVFWNYMYINSRKKDNFGVPSLKKDGLSNSDDKQKSEYINDQFTSLSPGLAELVQLSLDQGQIPLDWKTALVSPVFKKGNPYHILLETYMYLFNISLRQGKNWSCDIQLLITINDLAKGEDNNHQIDAVLLDFSKEFDKVGKKMD